MDRVKFEVIVSGRDIFRHVNQCMKSISAQSYQNYTIHLLSDGHAASQENVLSLLNEFEPLRKKIEVHLSRERVGKACLVYDYLQTIEFDNDSVVVMMDSDDMFSSSKALEEFAKVYKTEKTDACWSTYITSRGVLGHCAPLIVGLSHRLQGWKSSHCFTYKAHLMRKVPRHYILGPDGHPVMQACDIALALPILDIARATAFIPKILYRYTVDNPESHHNQIDGNGANNSKRQSDSAKYLYQKTPLKFG